jgi:quercetin dioxygenase-like cupin family protein
MGLRKGASVASDLGWRCVVTGLQADGRPQFQSDGSLRQLQGDAQVRLGRILSLSGPAQSTADGDVNTTGAEAGPGSLSVDAIVVTPTDEDSIALDIGSSESFEAHIVVRGQLHVTVGADEVVLGPGDVFLPRGQPSGMRASSSEEIRLVRVRCIPEQRAQVELPSAIRSSSGPSHHVRRVVAGSDGGNRPIIVQDGDPAVMFVIGDDSEPDVGLADVWELGGLVKSVDQGGDSPDPWALEPRASGMKILNLEMKPVKDDGAPLGQEGGWHATATIDVDIVVDGSVEMYLPNLPSVTLRPGDILVQRGTDHLWRAIGDRSLRMVTVMIGVLGERVPEATSPHA